MEKSCQGGNRPFRVFGPCCALVCGRGESVESRGGRRYLYGVGVGVGGGEGKVLGEDTVAAFRATRCSSRLGRGKARNSRARSYMNTAGGSAMLCWPGAPVADNTALGYFVPLGPAGAEPLSRCGALAHVCVLMEGGIFRKLLLAMRARQARPLCGWCFCFSEAWRRDRCSDLLS